MTTRAEVKTGFWPIQLLDRSFYPKDVHELIARMRRSTDIGEKPDHLDSDRLCYIVEHLMREVGEDPAK